MRKSLLAAVCVSLLLDSYLALAQVPEPNPSMNFFVTSEPIGDGGNLGGLAGADAHCQALAASVGAGRRIWHAYMSTQARAGKPAVNARDRIGNGNASWNSSHATRGCSQGAFESDGGAGLFYCFAIN